MNNELPASNNNVTIFDDDIRVRLHIVRIGNDRRG